MKRFNGKILSTIETFIKKEFHYCVVTELEDFKKNCDCIITPYLNPEFSILMPEIELIISEKGSVISHLAIIAREYGKRILLAKGLIKKIRKEGTVRLKIKKTNVEIFVF